MNKTEDDNSFIDDTGISVRPRFRMVHGVLTLDKEDRCIKSNAFGCWPEKCMPGNPNFEQSQRNQVIVDEIRKTRTINKENGSGWNSGY